jgi:hypothetical protein
MFIATSRETESNRLLLGIRFIAMAPSMTDLGRCTVEAYAKYLSVPAAGFISGLKTRGCVAAIRSVQDVANRGQSPAALCALHGK